VIEMFQEHGAIRTIVKSSMAAIIVIDRMD
jgi:hypothetical protein